ncbi:MAG: soluble lytic murein transglycosylase [Thermoleophilaceae bacterium]|nr:soluble lytic murein transglycosylase [Thermoleophilaceae bacterium]
MSQAATNTRRRSRARPAQRRGRRVPGRASLRRRRAALVVAMLVGLSAIVLVAARDSVEEAVRSITLPLKHQDIIRQQAADKNLDPALIAAVIYQESKFEDRTSHAGAKGLMQLLPSTAHYIARKSGGTAFESGDLATPRINIAYGSWYLRYLLDHYGGNERLAIAAYNAGETNVDRWVRSAGGPQGFQTDEIPFPETRTYVTNVEQRKGQYRDKYASELGIGN